jgi:hypothetical protein
MAEEQEKSSYRLPTQKCIEHSMKLAIVQDKPIMMDYWTSSLDKKVLIGVRENEEKLLIKSEEEYTSPVSKIFQTQNEYIVVTENSIYLVSNEIDTKAIR